MSRKRARRGVISEALFRLKHGTEHLNYGRDIVREWTLDHISTLPSVPNILDLGLGDGIDLINLAGALGRPAKLYGVDVLDADIVKAGERGIEVAHVDIERETYAFPDRTFDIVIANQVLEHTKEIFWVFSEVSRILKPGGLFVVGVPNLTSLHNRVAMLFGSQPPTIRVLGPHVRGFARDSLIEFAECGGFFEVTEARGSNFYPFPPWLSARLARLFPGLAVSLYLRIRRTAREGTFIEVLRDMPDDTTVYFAG